MNHELDAETTVRIFLSDSHTGCSRTLLVDGEKIEIKIPPGIRNQQKLRIRGKGNHQPSTGIRGDLYVRVEVAGAAEETRVPYREEIQYVNVEVIETVDNVNAATVHNTNYRRDADKPKKETRKAARISDGSDMQHEFASGIDTRWTRRLLVEYSADTRSAEVTKWFCGKNIVLKSGDGIARIQETRSNSTVWYDVFYNGDAPIRIYRVSPEEGKFLDDFGELCCAYLVIDEEPSIPAAGEYGLIKMPFAHGEMELVSIVNWKPEVGSIIEKGKKICDVTILDYNSEVIERCLLTAPCRLQISSVEFDSDKIVFTNGILLEYLRLHEVAETVKDPRGQGTYRNSGQGKREEVNSTIRTDTTYRNSGAGTYDAIGASTREIQPTRNSRNRTSQRSQAGENNIEEHIFWTSNNAFFYGKIAEWKEGRGNGLYQKNDIICEIRCFTPDSRPPFTEHVRASCDMRVIERLVVQGQQIANNYPLFKFAPHTNQSPNQHTSPQSGRGTSNSAQNNQITDPIEGLDEFIGTVRDGYAFQVRDVLEWIVTKERERIENERLLWRLGAGAATFFSGGLIDGFGIDDLISGMAMSNVAGMAHQFASKEQVEFLKKLQSEWLVLDRSPMDIRRRLGEAQGRFIGISRANILDMFNIHQSGSRGFHMVELDHAGNIAKGFNDPQSLEVLQRSCGEENTRIYSSQLYPSNITPLKLCRTITPEEARKKDPYYNQLSKAGAPFRVVYTDDTEGVMYKIQIPHHSDY